MTDKKIVGVEPKHITYVVDQVTGKDDLLVVKENIHYADGSTTPNLRTFKNYKRPFWITQKGRRNHKEKKDYEYVSNLTKYNCTQLELLPSIQRALGANPNGYLRQREVQRSPYVYGSDVTSTNCLRAEYRKKFPDALSFNTVAGGDIESDVVNGTGDIICMSVSYKTEVLLVYLASWISDIADPEGETLDAAKRLIPELIENRKLNIKVQVVDTPAKVALACIKQLHEWKPDWWSFWNINFDMSKIIATLENEGYNLAEVFSDPSLPPNFRYFNYMRGQTTKTTASGKSMSINVEDQWNWVTTPASFQPIDAMTVYRITRLAAGKDSSYALTHILKKELNKSHEVVIGSDVFGDIKKFLEDADKLTLGKGGFIYFYINDEETTREGILNAPGGSTVSVVLDFDKLSMKETERYKGLRWHEVMQTKHKIVYGVYNIVDSIRLEQLDEKTKDLASNITMYSKNSDYKNFNSNPRRLCDDFHFWYLERENPCVIGTASDQMKHELDQHVIGHNDWIITLPSYMDGGEGATCVEEYPNYMTSVYTHVADLDIVSTYPNVSQILNISRETCVMEFGRIEGAPEELRREFGVNLTGGRVNGVELMQKTLRAPGMDRMLDVFRNRNKPSEVKL